MPVNSLPRDQVRLDGYLPNADFLAVLDACHSFTKGPLKHRITLAFGFDERKTRR